MTNAFQTPQFILNYIVGFCNQYYPKFAFVELRKYLCTCDQSGEVVGVTELCNKKGGGPFTRSDEQIAQVYSVYCSMSVIHVSGCEDFAMAISLNNLS